MKAPNAEQTATSVLAAYQSLIDQGAQPGKATRERAEAIVDSWQASLAPTASTPASVPTEPGSPEPPDDRFTRQIFLFGMGVGALATLLLVAIVLAIILGARQ
jgi:hypothetical protein